MLEDDTDSLAEFAETFLCARDRRDGLEEEEVFRLAGGCVAEGLAGSLGGCTPAGSLTESFIPLERRSPRYFMDACWQTMDSITRSRMLCGLGRNKKVSKGQIPTSYSCRACRRLARAGCLQGYVVAGAKEVTATWTEADGTGRRARLLSSAMGGTTIYYQALESRPSVLACQFYKTNSRPLQAHLTERPECATHTRKHFVLSVNQTNTSVKRDLGGLFRHVNGVVVKGSVCLVLLLLNRLCWC